MLSRENSQCTVAGEVTMFVQMIEPAEAEGEVASIYANEMASMGRGDASNPMLDSKT